MKVLLINPLIPDYRLPIFNQLGTQVNLTILHSGEKRNEANLNFRQIVIQLKKIGPFTIFPVNLHKICKKFDIVISDSTLRHIDRDFLMFYPIKNYKWINWGIGVSASYTKRFDDDKKYDIIRNVIFKWADAQIFYSSYPINKYLKAGFKQSELFVANNTTSVCFDNSKSYVKTKLLFIGTLYKEKKIYSLLNAYEDYSKMVKNHLPLSIIGDGYEFSNIQDWIENKGMTKSITLHGSIFNLNILEEHFRQSIVCISPGQAGLSVLTSMGYGTPFISKVDAITGGEIFNIINHYNGILYHHDEELLDILIDISLNTEKYIKMGHNAREYYLTNRQPEQMIQALVDACTFVLSKNK